MLIQPPKPFNLPAAVREWYLLAANWNQGGLNVWYRPEELSVRDEMIAILTDTEGINLWGVCVADLGFEDPPVASEASNDIEFPCFSMFVGAMIANDVLVGCKEEPVDLNPDAARAALTCPLVSSGVGNFFADAPLEFATIMMFDYLGNGPALGKSRTPEGVAMLQRLQRHTA